MVHYGTWMIRGMLGMGFCLVGQSEKHWNKARGHVTYCERKLRKSVTRIGQYFAIPTQLVTLNDYQETTANQKHKTKLQRKRKEKS